MAAGLGQKIALTSTEPDSGPGGSRFDYLFGAVLALGTLFIISGPQIADTMVYIDQVRLFQSGSWTTRFNPIGEFGHLLWRPLCAVLSPLFLSLVPASVAATAPLKMAYGLIVLNEAAAVVAAALVFRIARGLAGSAVGAVLTTIGLLWAYGFLSYMKAGADYVFGTTVEICALWVLIEFRGATRLLAGGALLALAALFWTPFALIVPAAAAIPWTVGKRTGQNRTGMPDWLTVAVASGALYLLVLSLGAWLSGVRSSADLRLWIAEAGHGWNQNRTALRAVSGWSRLFFDLGNGGILLKRYLFKDPFNPVTRVDLVRLVLWRIAFFYALLAALFLATMRTAAGKRMLIALALATVPMLFFAIFLFEPSSPERFLPMLPFVLLTFAIAWRSLDAGPIGKMAVWAASVLLLSAVAANAPAMAGLRSNQQRMVESQLHDFLQSAAPGDALVSVMQKEPVTLFLEQRPFDPAHRGIDVPTFQVLGTQGSWGTWRESFPGWC